MVLAQEEMLWFQKSREKWVRYGNKNTKFFHTQTVIRRRKNRIVGLNIEGVWCSDSETLKREANSFFKQLFPSNESCSHSILELSHIPRISNDLQDILLQPISLLEVKEVIFSLNAYKAPRPDGFQPIFFQKFWQTIGKEV